MKNTLLILSIFAIGLGSCNVYTSPQQSTQTESYPTDVSYQQFYDDLSPYGQWIDYPGYGYVWAPTGIGGFKPYASNGYWVYADIGWTWVSGYRWGWAPFHYGRWFFDSMYGWVWIPGNEWAPAWVNWRSGSNYYGWSPMGPASGPGYAGYGYAQPVNSWNFVPQQYITSRSVNNYYVNESNNVTIINNTTVINYNGADRTNSYNGTNATRRVYTGGPDPREVERYTRESVRPVATRESNRPAGESMSNGQLNLFRPRVNETTAGSAQRPTPTHAEPFRGNRQPSVNTDNPAARPGYNGNTPTPMPGNRPNEEVNHRNNGNGQPVNNNVPAPPQNLPANGNHRGGENNAQPPPVVLPGNPSQNGAPASNTPVPGNHNSNTHDRSAQPGTQAQPVRTPVMKPVPAPANNPNMNHNPAIRPGSTNGNRPASVKPAEPPKKEPEKQQQSPTERHN